MGHPDQSADSGRRDAIKRMAVGAGAVAAFPILGQAGVTPAMARAAARLHAAREVSSGGQAAPDWKPLFFDQHQNESVVALTELIIPETIFGYYTSQAGMERELEYGGDDYHSEFPGACDHPEHQV